MNIKENMYARTNITDNCSNVYIVQLIEIDEDDKDMFWIDETIYDGWGCDSNYLTKKDIKKASYNIIDLIEVGDYVNGYLVERIIEDNNGEKRIYSSYDNMYSLYENEISSVLTHEQFECMEYKVNE